MSTRRTLYALVPTLAALGVGMTGSPAQAAGTTQINVWNSSHCLDSATQNASKLQMWSCGSGSEQRWLQGSNTVTGASTFTNQSTGRCITAPPSGPGPITLEFCTQAATGLPAANQQWRVYFADNPLGTGWYQVWQNVSSGLCLTTPSVGNGTVPQAADCDPGDQYDRWHFQ